MQNALPVRKSLRLSHYDYNTPGSYFITFCTFDRRNLLSHIVGAIHESPELHLTAYGNIVEAAIRNIPDHLPVAIDQFVIMPNHVHLIATITEENALRAIRESPLQSRSIISRAVGYIKMNASKSIRKQIGNIPVWQRGYYDHVIRNQQDYQVITEYISENPIRWEADRFYSKE